MFPQLISELMATKLSEKQIAGLVGSSQPSINRMRNGKQIPYYDVGAKLVELHRERCKPASTAA